MIFQSNSHYKKFLQFSDFVDGLIFFPLYFVYGYLKYFHIFLDDLSNLI